MAGEQMDLTDDNNILSIISPKNGVGGPYVVVFKNIEDRWAIVAMDWHTKPSLGIRWFWGTKGTPLSTGYPTWMIVPNGLINGILGSLPLDFNYRNNLNNYLKNEISGSELAAMN